MTIQTYPAPKSQVTSSFWRYTAVGGEKTLTGIDNAGVQLAYLPGQEQFFLNGVMLMRGTDYTATNGTSIVGLSALTAGDYIQITTYSNFTVTNIPVGSISGAITNLQLANSTFTIGSTLFNLGDTKTTIAGLTLTSPTINNPIVGTQYSTSVPLIVKGAAGQAVNLQEWQNSSGTPLVVIDLSGKVGIGTASPSRPLNLTYPNATIGISNTSLGGGSMSIDAPSNGFAQIDVAGANDIRINTNGSERMRITYDGKVGIGTSTPSKTLSANGDYTFGPQKGWSVGQPTVAGITSTGANCYTLKLNMANSANYYKGFTWDVHAGGGKDWPGHGSMVYYGKMQVHMSATSNVARIAAIQEYSGSAIDGTSFFLYNSFSQTNDGTYFYLTINYKCTISASDGHRPIFYVVTYDPAAAGSAETVTGSISQINSVYAV